MKPIFKCKCNDCEEELTEQNTDKSERDICNICWENRGWVVSHAGIIGMVKFREIQAAMRGRSHKAKVLIEAQKIILADNATSTLVDLMRGRSHKAKVLIEAQKIILADND